MSPAGGCWEGRAVRKSDKLRGGGVEWGGLQKKYSVYKVFPINCKNELCGRFHTLKEFSSGGTKFCVNKICLISVYQIGVKVTLY